MGNVNLELEKMIPFIMFRRRRTWFISAAVSVLATLPFISSCGVVGGKSDNRLTSVELVLRDRTNENPVDEPTRVSINNDVATVIDFEQLLNLKLVEPLTVGDILQIELIGGIKVILKGEITAVPTSQRVVIEVFDSLVKFVPTDWLKQSVPFPERENKVENNALAAKAAIQSLSISWEVVQKVWKENRFVSTESLSKFEQTAEAIAASFYRHIEIVEKLSLSVTGAEKEFSQYLGVMRNSESLYGRMSGRLSSEERKKSIDELYSLHTIFESAEFSLTSALERLSGN